MSDRRVESTGLVGLLAFGAVSAIAGGIGLLGNGIGLPLDWLDGSPFSDYTIPGIILGAIVGGSQLLAAGAMLRRVERSHTTAAIAGVVMMGWIASEVLIVGTHGGLMLALQLIYSVLGLAELALAARLMRERVSA
ncbi:MAG TPA: hypothetical protein VNE17_00025 [Nitrolancea sp.]|nr:hypothetical protein [Nitrolancea sp.]